MAKSAFNFNAQEPGGGGLEVRNISADPAAMRDHLMPRRPQPGLSDRFAATYVSEPDNRRGAWSQRPTPAPAGYADRGRHTAWS